MGVRGWAAVSLLAWSSACLGQHGERDPAFAGVNGPLVIWVVIPGPAPVRPAVDPLTQVHESTVGDFSSGVRSVSSAPAATNVTNSVDSIDAAMNRANHGGLKPGAEAPHDAVWESFASEAKNALPDLFLDVHYVYADDLRKDLAASEALPSEPAANTAIPISVPLPAPPLRRPDVLVGRPLPPGWTSLQDREDWQTGLGTLGVARWTALDGAQEPHSPKSRGRAIEESILKAAQHPAAAREFAVWLLDGEKLCFECSRIVRQLIRLPKSVAPQEILDVAKDAEAAVLSGGTTSSADSHIAEFSGPLAQALALTGSAGGFLEGLKLRVDPTEARANERFAVVALRGIVESDSGFGMVHGLVVLRANEDGRWRVLQVTPNQPAGERQIAEEYLQPYAKPVDREKLGEVSGVSLAAPKDGTDIGAEPQLWWDNKGGATLQVVEWQMRWNDWTDTKLYFVPDAMQTLRTAVTASFAQHPAPYRWRVWSLGEGGVMKLSPWRSMNVIAR